MKWAFWRGPEAGSASSRGATRTAVNDDADPGRIDPANALKVRARRRLIGATALLLAAVIVVPMVLDPAPRPVADTVPIQIPSEKTPFTPRLPLPPVPDPAPVVAPDTPAGSSVPTLPQKDPAPAGPEPAAKAPDTATASKDKSSDKGTDKEPVKPAASAASKATKDAEAQRAKDLLEGRATASAKPAGKYLVQAAALRNEAAAREMAAKLKQAGLPSFTERVHVSDGPRWRVRVGPYATRDEAEQARVRLRELGSNADLITP